MALVLVRKEESRDVALVLVRKEESRSVAYVAVRKEESRSVAYVAMVVWVDPRSLIVVGYRSRNKAFEHNCKNSTLQVLKSQPLFVKVLTFSYQSPPL